MKSCQHNTRHSNDLMDPHGYTETTNHTIIFCRNRALTSWTVAAHQHHQPVPFCQCPTFATSRKNTGVRALEWFTRELTCLLYCSHLNCYCYLC